MNKDTKNLVCVNGWWYLRARIKGAVIKKTLETKEIGIARNKRDQILAELRLPKNKKSLLDSVRIQLLGIERMEEESKQALDLGIKLGDMLARFLKDPTRKEVSENTLRIYQMSWGRYIDWMMKHYPHVQYARQVTRAMGREYAAECKERYREWETAQKYFTQIRHVWNIICEYDDNIVNPFQNVKLALKKTGNIVKQPFTADEMARIFSPENPVEFRLLSGFMYYLTLRWKEATIVRWNQLKNGYFEGLHGKTGADATTRIPEQLQELINLVPIDERGEFVFPSYREHGGNDAFLKQLRKLGIETNTTNGSGHNCCVKGAHSFRHTAITNALINGNSPAAVRRLAGHATEAMQRRYTHMDADIAGDVAQSLGKYW